MNVGTAWGLWHFQEKRQDHSGRFSLKDKTAFSIIYKLILFYMNGIIEVGNVYVYAVHITRFNIPFDIILILSVYHCMDISVHGIICFSIE